MKDVYIPEGLLGPLATRAGVRGDMAACPPFPRPSSKTEKGLVTKSVLYVTVLPGQPALDRVSYPPPRRPEALSWCVAPVPLRRRIAAQKEPLVLAGGSFLRAEKTLLGDDAVHG